MKPKNDYTSGNITVYISGRNSKVLCKNASVIS